MTPLSSALQVAACLIQAMRSSGNYLADHFRQPCLPAGLLAHYIWHTTGRLCNSATSIGTASAQARLLLLLILSFPSPHPLLALSSHLCTHHPTLTNSRHPVGAVRPQNKAASPPVHTCKAAHAASTRLPKLLLLLLLGEGGVEPHAAAQVAARRTQPVKACVLLAGHACPPLGLAQLQWSRDNGKATSGERQRGRASHSSEEQAGEPGALLQGGHAHCKTGEHSRRGAELGAHSSLSPHLLQAQRAAGQPLLRQRARLRHASSWHPSEAGPAPRQRHQTHRNATGRAGRTQHPC